MRCGADCKHRPCYMDWAYYRHFTRGREAWVVGGGLRSPWAVDHRGLFIQNRSTLLGNNVSGTSLARKFAWKSPFEQRCEQRSASIAGQGQKQAGLRKVVLTTRWTGRLGNLMFGAAGLIGVGSHLNRSLPASLLALDLPSSSAVPVAELFAQFPILAQRVPALSQAHGRSKYSIWERAFPDELGNCTACTYTLREQRPNAYDDALVQELDAWVAAPPPQCEVGLIELVGYFQSWKYFDNVPKGQIQNTFRIPPHATWSAVQQIYDQARNSNPGAKVIGVQVRLGDKLRGVYKDVYAPVTWEYYRVAMQYVANSLRASGVVRLVFIVTAGGTMKSNVQDMAEARAHLSFGNEKVFFSPSSDPHVDLHVLRRCDGLVISASSLGWWAAYLSSMQAANRIVAPLDIYNPRHHLAAVFKLADYYPSGWTLLANDGHGPLRTAGDRSNAITGSMQDEHLVPPTTPSHKIPPRAGMRRGKRLKRHAAGSSVLSPNKASLMTWTTAPSRTSWTSFVQVRLIVYVAGISFVAMVVFRCAAVKLFG